jgi:DTW domain-containing protein YfiP
MVIVQHPTEIWRPSNTTFLITQLYPSTLMVVRGDLDAETEFNRLLDSGEYQPYIIFPGDGAMEVGAAKAAGLFNEKPPLFVLLDGSWRQARRMRRRYPALVDLPTLSLEPRTPSVYRVRKQVRDTNLCTAEAAALLLGRFQGYESPDERLQKVFEKWIEEVIVFRGLPRDYRMPLPDWDDESAEESADES